MNKQYSDKDEYEKADHARSLEAIRIVRNSVFIALLIIVGLPTACQVHQTIYGKTPVVVHDASRNRSCPVR